jgi:hypothetical protein
MQRVRKQQKPVDKPPLLRSENACLAPAVGVAAKKNAARYNTLEFSNSLFQTVSIPFGLRGKWRAIGPVLAEGQITAKNC